MMCDVFCTFSTFSTFNLVLGAKLNPMFLVHDRGFRCEKACWCVAVDYMRDTGLCNMYQKDCTHPIANRNAGSSHRLVSRLAHQ